MNSESTGKRSGSGGRPAGGRTGAPRTGGPRTGAPRTGAPRSGGPRKPGDGPARNTRPAGDRADHPVNDRPAGDRPTGDRPYRARPTGDRPVGDRPTGDRPYRARPTGDRPTGDRPYRARPTGDRPTGDRPTGDRPYRARPTGDRPTGDRPTGDRPYRARPTGDRPTGDRPTGDRPYRARPTGDRPAGDRPTGDRPYRARPTGDRPAGDRPTGDRPYRARPTGDRPVGDKPFRARPVTEKTERPAFRDEPYQDRRPKSKMQDEAPAYKKPAEKKMVVNTPFEKKVYVERTHEIKASDAKATVDKAFGRKRHDRDDMPKDEKAPYVKRMAEASAYSSVEEEVDPVSFDDQDILNVSGTEKVPDERIEGRNPVIEALKSGQQLNKIMLEKDSTDNVLGRIAAMARDANVPVQYVDRRKLELISTTRAHQGVIAEVAAHDYADISDIIAAAEAKGEPLFLVMLDSITDPNNFGSIIRSAECAGAHGIIIPKRRSVALTATVSKVAAGAQAYVPVARVSNLVSTIKMLKEKGVWVAAADASGESLYSSANLKGSVCLVVGGEGEGISRLIMSECDLVLKIPMKGKISSLNAGVAAALMMFEISRQR